MAYTFTHTPFKWSRTGLDATAAEKALGLQGGMALPAAFLNQAWTKTYEALKETQEALSDGSWLGTEATLDDDSTNPVQNIAIYEELAKKVDVDGSKQLTDENFTLGYKQLFTMVDSQPTELSPYLLASGTIFTALSGKQDTEEGKGLSDNDFTTAMKTAVDSQAGLVVDSTLDNTSTHLLQNKVATAAINELKAIIYPKLTVTAFPYDTVTLSTGTTTLTVTPDSTGIFTVSLPKLGSWTIAQSYGGQLYSGVVGVYKAATSYSLDITFDTVLSNNSPAKIKAAADMGIAPNLWSVGDKVGIQRTAL